MNSAALTALVNRWRPEPHTFHLRAGEMAPTLQDVSMILGLPVQIEPLCMHTSSYGWLGQMEDIIGMAPPAPEDPKERAPAGAPFAWIRTHFGTCPQGANEDTNTARKMRRLAKLLGCRDGEIATSSSEEAEIPDDTILSQSISRGKKQATWFAYQLKPRGKAANRYTPDDYANRGKKVVTEEDKAPPHIDHL
ncbi:hypothetical protein QYE76_008781 [Lolium multiflorum]|uniref:Aminotransferase-like plant mobile domain-containing protein n=1 Tax=Lolium multiflorum TaxID=4521 RepID=A0AAD8TTK5_LOLMU|nr:hypothetical protein QYE76_008781 [Lolium multiflorum]